MCFQESNRPSPLCFAEPSGAASAVPSSAGRRQLLRREPLQESVGPLPGAAGPLTADGPIRIEPDRWGAVRKSENNQTCVRATQFELFCCIGSTRTGSLIGEVVLTSRSTWNVGTGSGCGSWTRLSRKSQSWSCRGGEGVDEIWGLEWHNWMSRVWTEELHTKLWSTCAAAVTGVLLTFLLHTNLCYDVMVHTDVMPV